MKSEESEPEKTNEVTLYGIAASPGIAMGQVLPVSGADASLSLFHRPEKKISPTDAAAELVRFEEALSKTKADIAALKANITESGAEEDANIFDAHLVLVADTALHKEVADGITRKLLAAECAFASAVLHYLEIFNSIEDPYLRERSSDIVDVGSRIMRYLTGAENTLLESLPGQRIIASGELVPSDTARLDRDNVLAFVTQTGSRTSHTSILARSMKIPAVVGIPSLLSSLRSDMLVIVDGNRGKVILSPSDETLKAYEEEAFRLQRQDSELQEESRLRPVTLDGYRVELAANIDGTAGLEDIRKYGAAGVGLFRTEYLFMNGDHLPAEEEQLAVYRRVLEASAGEPVVIRTLDIGGDKLSRLIAFKHEANPYLGLRSIRLCLKFPELLIPQLRAVLRAASFGHVRMMFPMVTCPDELDELLALTERVKESLRYDRIPFNEKMEIGMMVETPAAAMMPELFAKKCDFFSIGTNDLVQYTMAVDRGNENVSSLYRPFHPAVIRLIRRVTEAAREAGIWVSVCGEMAADPRYIPLLVGLGVQELSMSPISLGKARRLLRGMRYLDAEKLAEEAMKCTSHAEAKRLCEDFAEAVSPELLDMQ